MYECLASFIRGGLKKELSENIDTETLQIDNNSYIDSQLDEHFSDIVYNCTYKNGNPLKIALLFEHKSYVPDYPHLQLKRYILNIQEANIKQKTGKKKKRKSKLIPVLPIVLYHGVEEWEYKSYKEYFDNYPEEFLCYLPQFEYILINLNDYSEHEIKQLFDSFKLQVALTLMRNIHDTLRLTQQLPFVFGNLSVLLTTEKGVMFYRTTLIYLFSTIGKIHKDTIVEEIKTINPKGGEMAMTIAEHLHKTGFEKGIERGIEQGIEKGIMKTKCLNAVNCIKQGLDNKTIEIITTLTTKEISELRSAFLKSGDKLIKTIEKNSFVFHVEPR